MSAALFTVLDDLINLRVATPPSEMACRESYGRLADLVRERIRQNGMTKDDGQEYDAFELCAILGAAYGRLCSAVHVLATQLRRGEASEAASDHLRVEIEQITALGLKGLELFDTDLLKFFSIAEPDPRGQEWTEEAVADETDNAPEGNPS